MRLLLAPDAFAGTLTAVEAARAVAEGWTRRAPGDVIDVVPVSDGGPGFVDVVHATLGGELLARTVRGPFGDAVPVTVLLADGTAYVEAAQAAGTHLTGGERGEHASSYGVGELVGAAAGVAEEVVVGLGGLGSHDGGAGLLAALGASADVPLEEGLTGLNGVGHVDLDPARAGLDGVRLRAACTGTTVLAGLFGTTRAAGASRGIAEERLPAVDAVLEAWGAATDRRTALQERTGAGGGTGHALRLLGADLVDGLDLLVDAFGLAERARSCDVVLTGEASLDFSGSTGRVPGALAHLAAEALVPCVVLAGEVVLGRRELRAAGIEAAYAVADVVDPARAAEDPAGALADLAARVARTWSA